MRVSDAIKWYSKPGVAEELVRLAHSRETVMQYGLGGRGKRPDMISMPADVKNLARQGATSFHTSEERWSNPMELSPEINKSELDKLREGWDLIIDIDSPNIKYGKITAELILQAFKFHGIKNPSLKFSGNKGFHIGIPFKALPKSIRGEPIEKLFPEAPRVIATYLQEFIRSHLSDAIFNRIGDLKQIIKDTGKQKEELVINGEFDPYKIIELDTILIAPRHLFRMAYSLHEKSGLVSVVLKPEELKNFELEDAKPDNVKEIRNWFLNEDLVEEGEATQLVVQAFDWERREKKERDMQEITFEGEVDDRDFPPCIKHILNGLEDGRKRALFVLLNFFKCINWDMAKIAFQIKEWNKKNKPPLKKGYIIGQLNWHKLHTKNIPPPNCNNNAYYKDIGVCSECGVKNPLAYVAKKMRRKK